MFVPVKSAAQPWVSNLILINVDRDNVAVR
jgi:hypothetical protein